MIFVVLGIILIISVLIGFFVHPGAFLLSAGDLLLIIVLAVLMGAKIV